MIKFNFLGDIFVNSTNKYFKNLIKTFKKFYMPGDINFLNLEAPISLYGEKDTSKCSIKMDISLLEYLLDELNINVVNLANNHIFDYGFDGFQETISFLNSKNINFFGAGINLEEARKPLIININEKKIAFLGYSWDFIQTKNATFDSYGTAPLNKKIILEDIENIKQECDVIIISLHWGYEREIFPLPSQRKLAHLLIEHGADLIIGHHSHVPQGIEFFKGKAICYSLGNFYFDNYIDHKWNLIQDEQKRKGLLLEYYTDFKNINKFSYKFFKHNFIEYELLGNENTLLNSPLSLNINKYLRFWKKNRIRKDYPDVLYFEDKYGKKITNLLIKLYSLKNKIKILNEKFKKFNK